MTQQEQKIYDDLKKIYQYLQTEEGKLLLLNDESIRSQTRALQRQLTNLNNYSDLFSVSVCTAYTLLNKLEEKLNGQTGRFAPDGTMLSEIKDMYPFLFSQLQELDKHFPSLTQNLVSILCGKTENNENALCPHTERFEATAAQGTTIHVEAEQLQGAQSGPSSISSSSEESNKYIVLEKAKSEFSDSFIPLYKTVFGSPDSDKECVLIRWRIQVDTRVRQGDVIAEIVTTESFIKKIREGIPLPLLLKCYCNPRIPRTHICEIKATTYGIVASLLFKEGDVIPYQSKICLIN